MNLNQKRPLNPEELFRRLMSSDFKEAECIEQGSKIRQQRQVLIQLILQYESQIAKVNEIVGQGAQLIRYRQKLLLQVEQLQRQRQTIDSRIASEIQRLRLSPIQMRNRTSCLSQMEAAHSHNCRLKVRIKDLTAYIHTLQLQNKRLEEQRRIISTQQMQRRQVANQNWRLKIDLLKRQNLSYQHQIRQKIQSKLETSRRKIQTEELQIQERNRRRMQSFREVRETRGAGDVRVSQKLSQLSSPYKKIDDREDLSDGRT